jgi:hypothetical protein
MFPLPLSLFPPERARARTREGAGERAREVERAGERAQASAGQSMLVLLS